MNQLFVGSCPKDVSEPETNEDKFAFSENGNLLALCDGASESFNSKVWASIVAERFIVNPAIDARWLDDAVEQYNAVHDFSLMSWSKQASFERGSFSTLLGVTHNELERTFGVLAIGDCIAILTDGKQVIKSWPFVDPESFKQRPTLLSTLHPLNDFFNPEYLAQQTHVFDLYELETPILYCMTDALGEWALRQVTEGKGVDVISKITSQDALTNLVIEEREGRRMRVDDSTLIIITV